MNLLNFKCMQSQIFSHDWTWFLSLQQNYVAFSSHVILTIAYTYTRVRARARAHTHTHTHTQSLLQSLTIALSNYRSFESILSTYFFSQRGKRHTKDWNILIKDTCEVKRIHWVRNHIPQFSGDFRKVPFFKRYVRNFAIFYLLSARKKII